MVFSIPSASVLGGIRFKGQLTTQDLNNVKEEGYYYFGSADSLTNAPNLETSNSAGILIVTKSGGTPRGQIIMDMEKGAKVAVRFSNGTWRFV